MSRGKALLCAAVFAAVVTVPSAAPAADAVDCVGPAGDAAPGTAAWHARELREAYCGEQRASDTAANPLFQAASAQNGARDGAPYFGDPFRDPTALNGKRFRYEKVTFKDPEGQALDARLFRPCDASCRDMPAGLRRFAPPYPAVVVVHGGGADQEMYWWGAEALAEDGYMVLSFQVPRAENTGPTVFPADTEAAITYLTSKRNPRRRELDRRRIGLAGHSAGGVAVSLVGQQDRRVSAIVSWDRAQSSPMPAGLKLRTPALFMTADYN